jgi:hypothetical protein
MSSVMLRLILLALLLALLIGGERKVARADGQNIALERLDLDPAHPGPRRIGELIFENAWELRADNEDFGGISALTRQGDGRFIALSDAGTLIGFGLTNDVSANRPFIAPLPGYQTNDNYKDRDSEGMTHDPASAQYWVSYEAKHAIRRFSRSFARPTGVVRPAAMQDWPSNKGAECIARLSDGRFVVIAESWEPDDSHQALLFSGDPVEAGSDIASFSYFPPPGYRVTDCAQLPDGRLLLLHRRIGLPSGFAAKLGVLDIRRLSERARLSSKVIATIAPPLLIDNMEGLAVARDSQGTHIWLISDNNFSALQRTLLIQFKLAERTKKKPEAAAPGFDSL